jgi:hypothetical protein
MMPRRFVVEMRLEMRMIWVIRNTLDCTYKDPTIGTLTTGRWAPRCSVGADSDERPR